MLKYIFFTCLMLLGAQTVMAQTLVEDVSAPLSAEAPEGTFVETIKVISASKKIFVLTNNNQQLGPGDFISMALSNKLAARALVAKVYDGQAGIKIMKIYSLTQWGQLRKGGDVQIIKGDDSAFGKKEEKVVEAKEEAPKIKSEEDLYDDRILDDEGAEFDDKGKRHIKPDNLVSGGFGFFDADDGDGGTVRGNMFNIAWAFQFTDNYFAEVLYGRTMLDDYPGKGVQTLVNNVVGRVKYNFKAPLYSFIMPYVGFQSQTVSSPDAGKDVSQSQAARELKLLEDLKKAGVVAGVTVLRRLVPGWFIKADIGTDVINIGAAIEF